MESKFTITSFKTLKERKEKISVLTAYDYPTGKIMDGEVDVILVGDSLGMVKLGYKDTLSVTLEDMIYHTNAVRRGVDKSFIVTDMPFLTYGVSIEETIKNAGKILSSGRANAVKVEGGIEIKETIEELVKSKIPVMAHIGLTPQSVNLMGGFKIQGKTASAGEKLLESAKALESAGAFSIVIECIPEEIGKYITENLKIPTIGIGAGKYCDGQVLVIDDMLGMNDNISPKFVKKYENIGEKMKIAIKKYNEEVKENIFPNSENVFKLDDNEKDKIERLYN